MNNILQISQSNGGFYNWLAEIQYEFSQYIKLKNQLKTLDESFRSSNELFEKIPTQSNFFMIQNLWNQKVPLMQQITTVSDSIIDNLTNATKIILTSMLSSIEINNKLSILLNESSLGSIYSLVGQNENQLNLKEIYKQSCLMQNIPSLLSNIEIKTQMMRLSLPNFDNLKRLIRGY